MTNLLMAYLCAFALPLLFSSWRVALMGLGAQGLILGLVLYHAHEPMSASLMLEYCNNWVVRFLVVPIFLFRQMRQVETGPKFFLIPANFVQWTIAAGLVAMAYSFAERLSPNNAEDAVHIGTAAAGILIGMLILANQAEPIGQVVGLLTIEYGIALVELMSKHPMPLIGRTGVSLVFVVLVLVCGYFVRHLHQAATTLDAAETGGEYL